MVAIVQRYTNALASGLIPLLSNLSAGTEMASYGNAQWEFLIGSGEVTTFVAVDDADTTNTNTNTNTELLGCLLRIDMDAAPETKSGNRIQNDATADNRILSSAQAAGFGMMLVSPEARGKGVAKLLLHEAMYKEDDRKRIIDRSKTSESSKDKDEQIPRKILAVCTEKGQPLYQKLGFSDVGRVTALSATVHRSKEIGDDSLDGEGIRVRTYGSLNRASTVDDTGNSNDDSSNIDPEIRDLIAAMDARATGWDRRKRLNKLIGHSRGENLRSITAVATYQDNPIAAAVLRQEGPGSPFVIGPMVGSEASALPLISALARAIPGCGESENDGQLSIMVSEHPDLVDRLVEAGFRITFNFPAMTLDDRPIYENGDGSYLSLIHPTLG